MFRDRGRWKVKLGRAGSGVFRAAPVEGGPRVEVLVAGRTSPRRGSCSRREGACRSTTTASRRPWW